MRPEGKPDGNSYVDSRPGRHRTRLAALADEVRDGHVEPDDDGEQHDQGCLDGYAKGIPGCTCGIYDQPAGEPSR
jgi:hypothetical protein